MVRRCQSRRRSLAATRIGDVGKRMDKDQIKLLGVTKVGPRWYGVFRKADIQRLRAAIDVGNPAHKLEIEKRATSIAEHMEVSLAADGALFRLRDMKAARKKLRKLKAAIAILETWHDAPTTPLRYYFSGKPRHVDPENTLLEQFIASYQPILPFLSALKRFKKVVEKGEKRFEAAYAKARSRQPKGMDDKRKAGRPFLEGQLRAACELYDMWTEVLGPPRTKVSFRRFVEAALSPRQHIGKKGDSWERVVDAVWKARGRVKHQEPRHNRGQ